MDSGADVAQHPAGEIRYATPSNRAQLSRLAKSGRALRLTNGVYVVSAILPAEAIARHHLHGLIAHVWPGAVLTGRTALAGGVPVEGRVYVAHPDPQRAAPLVLPGVTAYVQIGPGHLPGDMPFPEGLWLSGAARGLLENVHLAGRPPRSRAGSGAVGDRIDELARTGAPGSIHNVLTQLDVIAHAFDPTAVELVRSNLAAVLGTKTADALTTSSRLRARVAGDPYDQDRVDMLNDLVTALTERAPAPRPAVAAPVWLAFFESYFSNYIEGTRFGVEEARAIVVDGVIPAARPADAHDVVATYRLAADPVNSARIARSGDDLIELLRHRHKILMSARPDMRPGLFKERGNYAGGYRFVDPELVVGTLRRGYDLLNPLVDAFARAVAMMVLITETHPFDDGNGRVARLAVNAELTAAGQARMIIPTVYRNNYIAALTAVSNRAGRGAALTAVLDYAQRWTTTIRWSDWGSAMEDLVGSNAFLDPGPAEAAGQRLQLPPQRGNA